MISSDLTIISKPHAHPRTMKKAHAKFKNDRTKNYLTIISKPHAHLHTMKKTHTSKRLVQNCKKSCAHKTPRVNVDGWRNGQTDEQTNGWKLACLSHHVKAGFVCIEVLRHNKHNGVMLSAISLPNQTFTGQA